MKPAERRARLLRIRAASQAWQKADADVNLVTGRRERMRTFLHEMWHGENHIRDTEDVPRAMGRAWRKAAAEVPDRRAEQTEHFEDAAERRRAAQAVIYSPEFINGLARLRHRRPTGAEEGILFLEANPICFHSGYDKQRVLRYLRGVRLTEAQKGDLRRALLTVVREGAGVEYREHCRTARIVDTVTFRQQLAAIRDDVTLDGSARQRAGWMLDALVRTNGLEPTSARPPRAGPRSRPA
jgi:hypothetical protein